MKMPPVGTSVGCRNQKMEMWFPCNSEQDGKPAISICEFPGNMINTALYKILAVFEKVDDRDFVIALHNAYLSSDPPNREIGCAPSITTTLTNSKT